MSSATLKPWMPSNPRWIARLLAVSMLGFVALLGGAIIFAWSGLYDIAASGGHWKVVEKFLEFGMRNSVKTAASGIEVPRLDDPDLIRLGAGHFHRGCAFCHGAPGMPVNPIAEQMLPAPPDLTVSMRPWKDGELFWIVKHGFKYTGMPGWVALERDDEIWAVVAFLKTLPTLDAAGYRDLALGDVRVAARSGSELATSESNPEAVSACARCHGGEGERPMSNLVPVLHGQPAEYLVSALKAYAGGKRRSGIMQPLAVDLRVEDIENLADYYAGLRHRTENLRLKMQPCSKKGASSRSKVCQRRVFPLAWRAIAAQVVRHLASLGSMAPIWRASSDSCARGTCLRLPAPP